MVRVFPDGGSNVQGKKELMGDACRMEQPQSDSSATTTSLTMHLQSEFLL
jgi:hypothetical protein